MSTYRPEDLTPDPDPHDSHVEFIHLNWDQLAAGAWEGYLEMGRGAMVIDLGAPSPSDSAGYWEEHLTAGSYIPDQNPASGTPTDWPSGDISQLVRTYDPEREVVVVILGEDDQMSVYRAELKDHPSPPDAWASRGRHLDA
jgi:hypothetical protein